MELHEQMSLGHEKAKRKYGQFDWAEKYFADTDLLNTAPRDMIQKVVEVLGPGAEAIPIKTFYGWYNRYRKARYPKKRKGQKTAVQESLDKRIPSKKKSWMDFEPSIPVPLVHRKESILKPVVDDPEI